MSDDGPVDPPDPRQPGWSPGQAILNSTGAREPEHTFGQPVPITARVVWADDGEEHIDTNALGDACVRLALGVVESRPTGQLACCGSHAAVDRPMA